MQDSSKELYWHGSFWKKPARKTRRLHFADAALKTNPKIIKLAKLKLVFSWSQCFLKVKKERKLDMDYVTKGRRKQRGRLSRYPTSFCEIYHRLPNQFLRASYASDILRKLETKDIPTYISLTHELIDFIKKFRKDQAKIHFLSLVCFLPFAFFMNKSLQ